MGNEQDTPGPAGDQPSQVYRASVTCHQVVTQKGVLGFYRSANYGCVVDDKGMVQSLWISDARYQRPHEGLMGELQMWLAMGKTYGEFDYTVETWAVYDKAAEWGILEFIPQDPNIGGYVVSINGDQLRAKLARKKAEGIVMKTLKRLFGKTHKSK